MLGVRLTKCQQIREDGAPAAQQTFTFFYILIGAPIVPLILKSHDIEPVAVNLIFRACEGYVFFQNLLITTK